MKHRIGRKDISKMETTSLGKVTVPAHVGALIDKYIERGYSFYSFLDDNHGYNDFICKKNENILMRVWMDRYEVEQEQLYTVTFEGGLKLAVWTIENDICLYNEKDDVPYNYRFELTKSEIESVDPILMGIAKPVKTEGEKNE